jgi:hypothetical protein
MREFRVTRLISAVAMGVASLTFSSGAVLLTAGPAAAVPGTTCASGSGSFSLAHPIPVEVISLVGCGNRNAVLTDVVDLTGGVSPVNIAWSSGNAMSVGTIQTISIDETGAGCPAGDVTATVLITITGGVYGDPPTSGVTHFCANTSGLPVVTVTASPVNL